VGLDKFSLIYIKSELYRMITDKYSCSSLPKSIRIKSKKNLSYDQRIKHNYLLNIYTTSNDWVFDKLDIEKTPVLDNIYFKDNFELKKVTIQSTYNGAGGYTIFNEYQNISESGLYTKEILIQRLIIGMGGKAAESVYYGDENVSLGATQDLKQTNSLAQQMIGNYGMGQELKTFYNENVGSDRNPFLGRSMGTAYKYSENIKSISDKETLELVKTAYDRAIFLLSTNRNILDKIVNELIEKNTLYAKDVYDLTNNSTQGL